MTKTIVTPENNSIILPVPKEYVGKKLEILMYSIEELSENNSQPKTMASYKGILTSKEAEQLLQYVKQSREEWDKNI